MPDRLFRIYQRHRIVNVNLNIIGAGLLAVAVAKWPVALATDWIGPEHKFINAIVAAVLDGIADILIYFALHWFANHWRPRTKKTTSEDGDSRFWREASLVQFERLTLTPAFFAIAIGGMWALQHSGVKAGWAYVISFSSAIIVTRLVHTAWGLKTGRFEIPGWASEETEPPAPEEKPSDAA